MRSNTILLTLTLLVVFGISFSFALGQNTGTADPCAGSSAGTCFKLSDLNPLTATTAPELVCQVVNFLTMKLMPPIAVLMMLWASFLLLTAGSNPAKVKSGKDIVIWTVIGAGVLILAPAVIALVLGVAGATNVPQACSIAGAQATFVNTLMNIINWFSWILAITSVVVGLYAGFLYMTAGGDPKNISDANKTLLYAVIGVVVAIVAFSIISLIRGFLGV